MNVDVDTIVMDAGVGTESIDVELSTLDCMSTLEVCATINQRDATVAACVQRQLPAIAAVVDGVVDAFNANGRLVYVGCGTSCDL